MAEKIGLWIPRVSSNISNMAGKCPQKIAWMSKKISSNSMVDFPACWMKPEGYIFVWFPVKKRFTTQKGCQNLWSPNAEMLKKVSHKHPYGFPRTPGLVLEN